jgi:hypothetical protein
MQRTVNNKFTSAPAIMSDSRTFTDWRSSKMVETAIMEANGISSSAEHRNFLSQNALAFMRTSDTYLEEKLSMQCGDHMKPSQDVHRVCSFTPTGSLTCLVRNPNGVGTHLTRDPASPEQTVEGYCPKMGSFGPAY